MHIKYAADLKPGDIVVMHDGQRTVTRIEWTEWPIDSCGTQGVRVFWNDRKHSNVLAADKQFPVYP